MNKRHKLYMLLGYAALMFVCAQAIDSKQQKKQKINVSVESANTTNEHLETILDNAQLLVQQIEDNAYDKAASKQALKKMEIAQAKLSPEIQETIKPHTSVIKQEINAFSAHRQPLAKYNDALAKKALRGLVAAIKTSIDDVAESVVTDAHQKIQRAIADTEKKRTRATTIINNARMQLTQGQLSPVQLAQIVGEQQHVIDAADQELKKITANAQKNVADVDQQAGYWSDFASGVRGFGAKIVAPLKAGYGYTEEQKSIARAIIAQLQEQMALATVTYKKTIEKKDLDVMQKAQIDAAYNQTMQELNNEIYQQQLITGDAMSFSRKLFWGSVAAAGIAGAAYLGSALLAEDMEPIVSPEKDLAEESAQDNEPTADMTTVDQDSIVPAEGQQLTTEAQQQNIVEKLEDEVVVTLETLEQADTQREIDQIEIPVSTDRQQDEQRDDVVLSELSETASEELTTPGEVSVEETQELQVVEPEEELGMAEAADITTPEEDSVEAATGVAQEEERIAEEDTRQAETERLAEEERLEQLLEKQEEDAIQRALAEQIETIEGPTYDEEEEQARLTDMARLEAQGLEPRFAQEVEVAAQEQERQRQEEERRAEENAQRAEAERLAEEAKLEQQFAKQERRELKADLATEVEPITGSAYAAQEEQARLTDMARLEAQGLEPRFAQEVEVAAQEQERQKQEKERIAEENAQRAEAARLAQLANEEKEQRRSEIARMSPEDLRREGNEITARLQEEYKKNPVGTASQETLKRWEEDQEAFLVKAEKVKREYLGIGDREKEEKSLGGQEVGAQTRQEGISAVDSTEESLSMQANAQSAEEEKKDKAKRSRKRLSKEAKQKEIAEKEAERTEQEA